jgi:hypothetical protein
MQQVIVALIVVAAGVFLGRQVWRAVASARSATRGGCDSGCGCAPTTSSRTGSDPLTL